MENKKLVRFVESLILLPIATMTSISGVPVGPIAQATLNIVSSHPSVFLQKLNNANDIFALNNSEDIEAIELQAKMEKAKAIDAYFEARNMPLAGTGMKMVEEAEKNDIDWRLLPAIAVRESTGGKFACKGATYSAFGWGSCKINFDSHDEGIETVARNLGGNNPNTDHHYAGKTTKQILQKYNPPSIVPHYAEQVMRIMDVIGPSEMTINTTTETENT